MIREIKAEDFDGLMRLYTYLHDNPIPEKSDAVMQMWSDILNYRNHHIVIL